MAQVQKKRPPAVPVLVLSNRQAVARLIKRTTITEPLKMTAKKLAPAK